MAKILSTILFPPVVSAIPVFILVGRLGLTDTYPSLIIPHAAFNLPIIIWMLRSFIEQVPFEIDEAARIDGLSHFGIVRHMICRSSHRASRRLRS